jgi:hypothetical protein
MKSRICKNSHIGHCILNSKSTNIKAQNMLNMRINITCSTNCKYSNSYNAIYSSNMVCSMYIIVNILHNCDDDDDNDDDNNNNNNSNNAWF